MRENSPHNEPSTESIQTIEDLGSLRQGEINWKDRNELLSRSEENTQNIGKELFKSMEIIWGSVLLISALEGQWEQVKLNSQKGLPKQWERKKKLSPPF